MESNNAVDRETKEINEDDFDINLVGIKVEVILEEDEPKESKLIYCEECIQNYDSPCMQHSKVSCSNEQVQSSYVSEILDNICQYPGSQLNKTRVHCAQCSYSTIRSHDLKKHMRIHTGEKLFECNHCSKAFSMKTHMKTHIISIHLKDKSIKCKLCDYSTARLTDLKSHMKSHSGEKPYNCKYCNYITARSSDLIVHIRSHTGEKPYKCKQCDYAASRLGTLKRHMRTHSGEKPYRCAKCNYASSQSGTLKIHMATQHEFKNLKT